MQISVWMQASESHTDPRSQRAHFSKPETAEPIVFYPENVTAPPARARPYIKHYSSMHKGQKPFG